MATKSYIASKKYYSDKGWTSGSSASYETETTRQTPTGSVTERRDTYDTYRGNRAQRTGVYVKERIVYDKQGNITRHEYYSLKRQPQGGQKVRLDSVNQGGKVTNVRVERSRDIYAREQRTPEQEAYKQRQRDGEAKPVSPSYTHPTGRTGQAPYREQQKQPVRTPVFYGAGYDQTGGVGWVREGASRTPEGVVARYDVKTTFPGRKETGRTTGTLVQTVTKRGRTDPAPKVTYPDTGLGDMYRKAEAIDKWQAQAGVRAERTKNAFSYASNPAFGSPTSFGNKMFTYSLSLPALLTVGLGEQVAIASTKGYLFTEALIRKDSRERATTEMFKTAPVETVKELGNMYNPTTPEGVVNIILTGAMIKGIGGARATARATTPQPGSVKPLGSKSYVKGGETFNVQKGTFTSKKGDVVRYDVRSTEKSYYVRLKDTGGNIITEGVGGLKTKTTFTPRKDAFGQPLEGMFDFKTDTTYKPKGGLKSKETTTGEMRLGRSKTDKGRVNYEEVSEFNTFRQGRGNAKDFQGFEVSDVTTQGKTVQTNIKTSSFARAKSNRMRVRGGTKKGEFTFGSRAGEMGAPSEFSSMSKPSSFTGSFAKPRSKGGIAPTEELLGGKTGSKPALGLGDQSLSSTTAREGVRSKVLSSAFSMSATETGFKGKTGVSSAVDVGGRSITEYTSGSIFESGSRAKTTTKTISEGVTGTDFVPRPPPPTTGTTPGIIAIPFRFPGISEPGGKRKRLKSAKGRGFGYTPSFVLSAGSYFSGKSIVKTPKTRRKKKFTGLELRGL